MSALTLCTDQQLLALTAYGEARGEGLDGVVAVCQVVRNRLQQPERFGTTWREVMLRAKQFSCWNVDDRNRPLLEQLAERLVYAAPLGMAKAGLVEALWIADGVMAGRVRDLARGATHYHATTITAPYWATGQRPVTVIGHHAFYASVA